MTRSTRPDGTISAIKIGKAIDAFSHEDMTEPAFKSIIIDNIDRPDGDPIDEVTIAREPSLTNKVVIVPDSEILDTMKPSITDSYFLSQTYLSVAAKKILEGLDGASDDELRERLQDLSSVIPSPEDFFHFRLGEYSVTQCQ